MIIFKFIIIVFITYGVVKFLDFLAGPPLYKKFYNRIIDSDDLEE